MIAMIATRDLSGDRPLLPPPPSRLPPASTVRHDEPKKMSRARIAGSSENFLG